MARYFGVDFPDLPNQQQTARRAVRPAPPPAPPAYVAARGYQRQMERPLFGREPRIAPAAALQTPATAPRGWWDTERGVSQPQPPARPYLPLIVQGQPTPQPAQMPPLVGAAQPLVQSPLVQTARNALGMLPQLTGTSDPREMVRRYGPDVPGVIASGAAGVAGDVAEWVGRTTPEFVKRPVEKVLELASIPFAETSERVVGSSWSRVPDELFTLQNRERALNEEAAAARRAGDYATQTAKQAQAASVKTQRETLNAGMLQARRQQSGPQGAQMAQTIVKDAFGPESDAMRERYRQTASPFTQLAYGAVLDPLNIVDLGMDVAMDARRVAQARRARGPSYMTVVRNGRRVQELTEPADELARLTKGYVDTNSQLGRATQKLNANLNPFHLTPQSMANSLARNATDNIIYLRDVAPELISNPDILADLIRNPNKYGAATGGFTQSADFKRTAGLVQRIFGGDEKALAGGLEDIFKRAKEGDEWQTVADLARRFEDASESLFAPGGFSKNPLQKTRDTLNNYLSIGFMGYNPGYAFRNAANNLMTAMADGVTPFQSSASIRDLWTKWGPPPIATKQGIGAAGDVWKSPQTAAAYIGSLSDPYRLRDVRQGMSWKSPTLQLGQNFERYASERIMAHHIKHYWSQVWGGSVERMKGELIRQGIPQEWAELWARRTYGTMHPRDLRRETSTLLGGGDLGATLPVEEAQRLVREAGPGTDDAARQIASASPAVQQVFEETIAPAHQAGRQIAATVDTLADKSYTPGNRDSLLQYLTDVQKITDDAMKWDDELRQAVFAAVEGMDEADKNVLFGQWREARMSMRRDLYGRLDSLDTARMPELGFDEQALRNQIEYRAFIDRKWVESDRAIDGFFAARAQGVSADYEQVVKTRRRLWTDQQERRRKRTVQWDDDIRRAVGRGGNVGTPPAAAAPSPEPRPTNGTAPSSTGLTEMGSGMAQGAGDALYRAQWDALQRGRVDVGGVTQAELQAAKIVRDAGGLQDLDTFKRFVQEVDAAKQGKTGVEYQRAIQEVVDKYTPKQAAPSATRSEWDIRLEARRKAQESSPHARFPGIVGEDAPRSAGYKFWSDERGYNGNRPAYRSEAPDGTQFQWDNTMRHGGADPWQVTYIPGVDDPKRRIEPHVEQAAPAIPTDAARAQALRDAGTLPELREQPAPTKPVKPFLPASVQKAVDQAEKVRDYWRTKVGSYQTTNMGLPEGGRSGKAKGGTYTEINERRAAQRVSRMERLIAQAPDKGLSQDEVAEIKRAFDNLPRDVRKPPKVQATPRQPWEPPTIRREGPAYPFDIDRIEEGMFPAGLRQPWRQPDITQEWQWRDPPPAETVPQPPAPTRKPWEPPAIIREKQRRGKVAPEPSAPVPAPKKPGLSAPTMQRVQPYRSVIMEGQERPIKVVDGFITTPSGRRIPGPPAAKSTGDRGLINQNRKVDEWLLEQAIAEADARGDTWNAQQFRLIKPQKMRDGFLYPESDHELLGDYLFGTKSGDRYEYIDTKKVAEQAIPPIAPPAVAPQAAAREPWMMTRDEFTRSENQPILTAAQGALNRGNRIMLPGPYRTRTLAYADGLRLADSGEIQAFNGKTWDTLMSDDVDRIAMQVGINRPTFQERVYHAAEVERALQAGQSVPPEVLSEYPDLAAKYGKAAQEAASIAPQSGDRLIVTPDAGMGEPWEATFVRSVDNDQMRVVQMPDGSTRRVYTEQTKPVTAQEAAPVVAPTTPVKRVPKNDMPNSIVTPEEWARAWDDTTPHAEKEPIFDKINAETAAQQKRYADGTTAKQLIDGYKAQGYRIEEGKRGAVKVVKLTNGEREVTLRDAVEQKYARHALAEPAAPAPVAAAEPVAEMTAAERQAQHEALLAYRDREAAEAGRTGRMRSLIERGQDEVPGVRLSDAEEAGKLAQMRDAEQLRAGEWDAYVEDLWRSNKIAADKRDVFLAKYPQFGPQAAQAPVAAPAAPAERPDWSVRQELVDERYGKGEVDLLRERVRSLQKSIDTIDQQQLKPLRDERERLVREAKKLRRNTKAYNANYTNQTGVQADISEIESKKIAPLAQAQKEASNRIERIQQEAHYLALAPATGDNEVYRRAALDYHTGNPESNEYGAVLNGLSAVLQAKGVKRLKDTELWRELSTLFHDPISSLPVNTPIEDIAKALDGRIGVWYKSPDYHISDIIERKLPSRFDDSSAAQLNAMLERDGSVWKQLEETKRSARDANRGADIVEALAGPTPNTQRLRDIATKYQTAADNYSEMFRSAATSKQQAEAFAKEQATGLGKVIPAPADVTEYTQGKVMAKTGLTEAQSVYVAKKLFEHGQETGGEWKTITINVPGDGRMTFRNTATASRFYELVIGSPFPGMKSEKLGGTYNFPATMQARATKGANQPTRYETILRPEAPIRRLENEALALYGETAPDRLRAQWQRMMDVENPDLSELPEGITKEQFGALVTKLDQMRSEGKLAKAVSSIRADFGGKSPFALGITAGNPEQEAQRLVDATDSAVDTLRQWARTFQRTSTPVPALTPEQRAVVEKFMREQAVPAMIRDKAVVNKVATTMRDFALGDYAKKRNIHEWLSYLYPYSYWYTFTFKNWAQRLAQNPSFIANYARYRAVLKQINDEYYREVTGDPNAQAPEYWAGMLRVPFEGTELWFNLEQTLNPLYSMVSDFTTRERGEVPPIQVGPVTVPSGATMEKLGSFGPTMLAPLVWAYSALLASKGYKDAAQQWAGYLFPGSKAIKAGTALYKEAGLPGSDIIPPGGAAPEQAFLHNVQGGDIWERRRIGLYLYGLLQDGTITSEQFQDAAYQQQGEAWDMARQAEAVSRAPGNLASFMLGAGFKPRSDQDVQLDRMWKDWGEVWDKRDALGVDAWKQAMDTFEQKYPWAKAVMMARNTTDDLERLKDYTYLVLDRLPPGQQRYDMLTQANVNDALLTKFYNAKGDMSAWTPLEREQFRIAIETLASQVNVPSPTQKAAYDQAVADRNRVLTAAATKAGVTVDQARALEDGYYAIPETNKAGRKAYLAQHPELKTYWDTKRALGAQAGAAYQEYYPPSTGSKTTSAAAATYAAKRQQITTELGPAVLTDIDNWKNLSNEQKSVFKVENPERYALMRQAWDILYGPSTSRTTSTRTYTRYRAKGGGGGGSYRSYGSASTPAPVTPTTPAAPPAWNNWNASQFNAVWQPMVEADPALPQLVAALFGGSLWDALMAWLALPADKRAAWIAANPLLWQRIGAFMGWLTARQGQPTAATQVLASIPPNAPPPATWLPPAVPTA